MKVHEYQAKELLKAAGVAVPEGIVVTDPKEAAAAYDKLGGGLIVVKAQVHAGGRGKGVAIGPEQDRAEALEIASGRKPRPEGMAKGVQLVRSARGGRRRGRQPARQDPGHLPDRRRGPGDLEGARDRRARHRPRAVPRPGRRSRPAVPGADGLDRGGRRDRDGRARVAREDPPRADRRRPRPGRLPGAEGLQGARADGRDGQEGRGLLQAVRATVPRHGRLARRDQPADRDRAGRRPGPRLQAELRRQRHVPPPRHRRDARRGRGRPRRAPRRQERAELRQPRRQHRLPGQRRRPGDEHDGPDQVPRRRARQLPRRRRRREQGPGARRLPDPARLAHGEGRAGQHLRRHHEVRHDRRGHPGRLRRDRLPRPAGRPPRRDERRGRAGSCSRRAAGRSSPPRA